MQETPVQFLDWEDSPGEGLGYPLQYSWASLVAQLVKNPPAMRETWVRSLGWDDPLETVKATAPVFRPERDHVFLGASSRRLINLDILVGETTWSNLWRACVDRKKP